MVAKHKPLPCFTAFGLPEAMLDTADIMCTQDSYVRYCVMSYQELVHRTLVPPYKLPSPIGPGSFCFTVLVCAHPMNLL